MAAIDHLACIDKVVCIRKWLCFNRLHIIEAASLYDFGFNHLLGGGGGGDAKI